VARPTEIDAATIFSGSWIGTDEAGKGDYFGPLVAAGVAVDDRTAALLIELGARDSKTLSNTRVRELAELIRRALPSRDIAVVTIAPERYNSLYAQLQRQGKSLNDLLAWGHARVVEDLLERDVTTRNVLVDRFTEPAVIANAFLRETRNRRVNLEVVPRAEHNVAVAAASIVARARFLAWFEQAKREFGVALPLGASAAVVSAARAFVAQHGADALRRVAKLHFKTTHDVLR
jgi:ribonuclease HIII